MFGIATGQVVMNEPVLEEISEWNEQISGDYGGQNMKDYLSAIDKMKEEPFIDETRLGAF